MPIQPINTIKKWFKTGLKPSQNQFWDTWDSFRHKYEQVPIKDIEDLEATLNTKAEKSELDGHKSDINAHSQLFAKKEDKVNKGVANGYVPLDEVAKIAAQYLDIVNNLVAGGATSILSAEQGVELKKQIDLINNLLKSDNVNLNTLQKIVDTIEEIQLSLSSLLVNDLTTGGTTKALTAEMGKILQSTKEEKSQKGVSGGYAPLNSFTKLASQYLDIVNDLISGGSNSLLSAEQGKILQNQINGIHTLLQSDNVNLDTLQEIVDAIEEVQMSLSTILVNDLTTGGATKALTAEMGKLLQNNKVDKVTGKSLISDTEITRLAGINNAVIATDAETQISAAVAEDSKVVSRLKLFNWWKWIESTVLHKTGNETFTGIKSSVNTGATQINGISLTNNGTSGSKVMSLTATNSGDGFLVTNTSTATAGAIAIYNSAISSGASGTYIQNNAGGRGIYGLNGSTGTFAIFDSATNSTGDLLRFAKSGTPTTVFNQNGIPSFPYMIIPSSTLVNGYINGAIQRDETGQLWETHNGVRSRLITTADDLIFVAYKSAYAFELTQQATTSTTKLLGSNPSSIGKIGNKCVSRLNAMNDVSLAFGNGTRPLATKIEIFLKIENGLFNDNGTLTNQVKIMEYSGNNIAGAKNYQSPFITDTQNVELSTSAWTILKYNLQREIDNQITNQGRSVYLRDASNTRAFGAGEASFSFVVVNTIEFEDANNSAGKNAFVDLRNTNYTFYLETIKQY